MYTWVTPLASPHQVENMHFCPEAGHRGNLSNSGYVWAAGAAIARAQEHELNTQLACARHSRTRIHSFPFKHNSLNQSVTTLGNSSIDVFKWKQMYALNVRVKAQSNRGLELAEAHQFYSHWPVCSLDQPLIENIGSTVGRQCYWLFSSLSPSNITRKATFQPATVQNCFVFGVCLFLGCCFFQIPNILNCT